MKNKLIILGGDEDNNKIKSTFERAKVSDVILIIGSLSEKFTSEAMVLNCSIEPKDDIGLAHKFNIFWSENSDLINYSHLNNKGAEIFTKLFLKEIHRILKPSGKVFISTPNKEKTIAKNPWHYKEFSLTELENMMPYERDLYFGMLIDFIEQPNENK